MLDAKTAVFTSLDYQFEVTDPILSYLSPAALDAARYNCKAWIQYIMSNRCLMSSILNKPGEIRLRHLLKGLARGSDLLTTLERSDVWRTCYRMCNLMLNMPERTSFRGTSGSTHHLAAAVTAG
jgi:hypothetical protein